MVSKFRQIEMKSVLLSYNVKKFSRIFDRFQNLLVTLYLNCFLGDGICSIEELQNFYKDVIGVDGDSLTKVTTEGYRALTAVSKNDVWCQIFFVKYSFFLQGNQYKLNKDNYLYCFASFLLGRNIYGPGKYIFGVFDTREMDETYKVIYNVEEDENWFEIHLNIHIWTLQL